MSNLSKPPVFLIDGSGYIFRAYFAVRSLSRADGLPTNAIYGFSSMLLKTLTDHKPAYVGIAFDLKGPTFRNEIYKDYKANRPPAPEDLAPQFDYIHRAVEEFGIHKITAENYEADDVLGTLAKQAVEAGHPVRIITGDKDLMQLVTDDVMLIDEMRSAKKGGPALIDKEAVINKFGVPPEQVIDLLALAGDTSDNVPGVKGIGPKTAADFLKEFGTLERLLDNAHGIPQKGRREKMLAGIDLAKLSKDLVTIRTDVPLSTTLEDLQFDDINAERLDAFFAEMEFKRLRDHKALKKGTKNILSQAEKAKNRAPRPTESLAGEVAGIDSLEPLFSSVKRLENAQDLPSTKGKDLYVHVSTEEKNNVRVAPYTVVGIGKTGYFFDEAVSTDFWSVLDVRLSEAKHVYANHIKPVFHLCPTFRMHRQQYTNWSALSFMSFALDADVKTKDYTAATSKWLGLHDPEKKWQELEGDVQDMYLASRLTLLKRLCETLDPMLSDTLQPLLTDIENPCAPILADMEQHGIKVDLNLLSSLSEEYDKRLKVLEQAAYDSAGEEFNVQSPSQLSAILFDKLGLKVIKKTKTGASTDSSVLEALKDAHDLPAIILEHRILAKLKNTYIDVLPTLVDTNHRIHTTFKQTIAATGRLSSVHPNLQNIPIRTAEGRRIREAFVAADGLSLIGLDYSQIELRILAHLTKDPTLIDTFEKDQDVHRRTAAQIFDKALDAVSDAERSAAKAINFGLMYGMGALKLSKEIGVSRKEAKEFIERYFKKYGAIKQWQQRILEDAKSDGFVTTLFGRRRPLPGFESTNRGLVAQAERLAINTPVQGSAADIVKIAMIHVSRYLKAHAPDTKMLLQVHDELIFETPQADALKQKEAIQSIMQACVPLRVPLKVNGAAGARWSEIH